MWQNFFNKPKVNYNPYMYKLKDYPKYIMYDKEEMNMKKGKWKEYFNNTNPIYLEIGSGNGNFSVRNAEKFQDKNFMAIELKFKRLVLSARKAEKRNLENVLFFRRWGQEIPEFVMENEIEGVYLNFPDPWDGREKNRILQENFFDELLTKILKKGGKFFFKTDHTGYYEDTLVLMKNIKNYKIIHHTDDLHNDEKSLENIRTEFEDLFTKKGIKTKYIEIEKLI